MDPNERKGWTEIVTADDIDSHMDAIGQAQVNAYLVEEMLDEFPLGVGDSLFVPGCGTGQMFEYITPQEIGDYWFTFMDLNPSFLKKLEERLWNSEALFDTGVSDIEKGGFSYHDGVLAVLLLQHVEWRKAVDSMMEFHPSRMYFIIQEQDGENPVTEGRELAHSIAEFAKIARGRLVPKAELTDYLAGKGYNLLKTYEEPVPDAKTMVGLVFEKG